MGLAFRHAIAPRQLVVKEAGTPSGIELGPGTFRLNRGVTFRDRPTLLRSIGSEASFVLRPRSRARSLLMLSTVKGCLSRHCRLIR